MSAEAAGAPVPAVVIGGWLGAGKTTLVNHLLREEAASAHGRRIAVLVNDFGDINIDADLIQGADGEVLSLAGGCVCCSFGADLVGTLNAVLRRAPPPDVVLIETSGVGLPAAVARTAALVPGLVVRGCVVVADASSVQAQAADRYVGDTVRQQLHEADLLLLSKLDLLAHRDRAERADGADRTDAGAVAALQRWLQALPVEAPGVPAVRGEVAADIVLGVRTLEPAAPGPVTALAPPLAAGRRPWRRPAAAAQRFVVEARHFAEGVDARALGAELLAAGALRAKGLLFDAPSGRWLELQLAGRRLELQPLAHRPTPATAGRLVCIRLREPGPP